MKRNLAVLITCLFFGLVIIVAQFSCKHEIQITCAQVAFKISASQTDALAGATNGTITVTATGGKGFQYSLNGGPFQDTGYFTGLSAFSNYRVLGRNAMGLPVE